MRGLFVIVLVSCGGAPAPSPPVVPVAPAPDAQPPSTQAEVTPERICDRVAELGAAKCGTFDLLQRPACLQQFGAQRTGEDARLVQTMGRCLVEHQTCESVMVCLGAMTEPQRKLRACTDADPTTPVGVPASAWATRIGAAATKYSQAVSTKALPIEVCGIQEENAWLAKLACEDGSHPINSDGDAEQAREGTVGTGGKCGAPIDHYRVACPERRYDIFIDAYVCPRR